jgi:dipicolinate synthase subunit A
MNEIKICLLGGDRRQIALARTLGEKGYECALWGVFPPGGTGETFTGVRCADAQSAVTGSRAVILPLPATADGVRVHCPLPDHTLPEARQELRLTHLMEMVPHGVPLLAGRPGDVLRTMARDAGLRLIDYYEREEVQIRNSVPTAEGALALAMRELPVTVFGAPCTVLGYGRVGRRLSEILRALGAQVTVAARSLRDLSWAAVSGCRVRPLPEYLRQPDACAVLFNTIPTPVVDEECMDRLPPDALCIELASSPGGFTPQALKNSRQRILRAPSLPGAVAPDSAGRILGEAIARILEEEGVGRA